MDTRLETWLLSELFMLIAHVYLFHRNVIQTAPPSELSLMACHNLARKINNPPSGKGCRRIP